ncbi:uncharacterized protein PHACADRAFT_201439 [Phanerochaete carnosa HHB-10118-sp]|uniref:DUF6533 domain-containing protein n=1 Tax=Phanerochaete carnosa (strain HHB-10118-sp) TaxID=650164 RepID=K5VT39_PHACS|nr:uncharacterized protein PHACADRAFT_201439 [Phanerochaete carnosa HHB-10118-sp]EKM49744.1 hypothetical protein PHACADRAFT_201439 [Phanerochaete carnosa HHB-10118-sp]
MQWIEDTAAHNRSPAYLQDVAQTRMTTYMGFVSFTILVWDHIITFGDEVYPRNYVGHVQADK